MIESFKEYNLDSEYLTTKYIVSTLGRQEIFSEPFAWETWELVEFPASVPSYLLESIREELLDD